MYSLLAKPVLYMWDLVVHHQGVSQMGATVIYISITPGTNAKMWLRIFVPNKQRIFGYSEMDGKRKVMTSCIGLGMQCLIQTLQLLSQLFVWLIPLMSPRVNIAVRFQRAYVNGPKPSALEVLPHVRFTTAFATKTSTVISFTGHFIQ